MTIYGIPILVYWVVGAIAVILGITSILFPDRMVRGMRALALRQLKWLRSPRYRQWLKVNGWLLLVLGVLTLVLLTILSSIPPADR
ncbi:MAG: hypothetical protein QNJ15_09015 [Erythrobacter sp.]|nr:hypothetical protein [Erythrobacter sp.]